MRGHICTTGNIAACLASHTLMDSETRTSVVAVEHGCPTGVHLRQRCKGLYKGLHKEAGARCR